MLIVCPSCATSYDVEPASLQPNGRQVRCVRCRAVWRADLSRPEKLVAAAAALAPEHGSPEVPIGSVADEEVETAEAYAEAARQTEWLAPSPDGRPTDRSFEAVAAGLDPETPWSVDSHMEPGDAVAMESPPIAPVDLDAGRAPIDVDADHGAGHASAPPEDVETFAARRSRRGAKRRPQLWPPSRLRTIILVLLVVDAILVCWRKDIVRVLPQTASFYAAIGLAVNLRGLSFDDVATGTEAHEGVPILVVQGSIVNDTGAAVDVPRLKLAVRNAAKQEIYSWTAAPPRARLSPYQAVAFRTRLAAPPPETRGVLVRFLNRRDVVAETR